MRARDLPAAILGVVAGIFFMAGLAVVEAVQSVFPFLRRSTPTA